MAYEYYPRGNPKRTKSDHQKQQFIVPPAFHNSGQFPPGFFPYEYVPLSQPSWQGNANNSYAPAWNGSYWHAQPYRPPPPSLTPELKKRERKKGVIHPPSEEYLATKLSDNPLGLTNMIPQEELDAIPAVFHTPWIWNPTVLKEDEPASPPSPTTLPEEFTSKLELKPTFSSHIVRTPYHYIPGPHPRQTMEPGRITSSNPAVSSSSVFIPAPLPSVPLYSTSDDYIHSPLIIPHSTFFVPPVAPRRSSESPPPPITPVIPPSPISQNEPPSYAMTLPRSASSAINATPTARESQPVDPPTRYEVGHEDEPEYLTPNANQTAQLLPQNSERGAAPWILASRKLHAPKKAVDVQFMARMADLRQQSNGTSSTSSTPQTRGSMALLGSPVSIASSAFSQSFSITSPPPAVEFPPTPVFADQIPEGFMRKLESLSVAQTSETSVLRKPYPLQNSHPATAIRSLDTIHEVATSSSSNSTPRQQPIKLPVSTSLVRRGYWNRRGDHLTPEGYLVFPPKSMQYPDELKTYPSENEGYLDHSGLYTDYVRRPELPQSLPKRGNPPERPYDSFVVYV